MRDFLIDVINHRFVITFTIVILAVASYAVFQDGFAPIDLVVALGAPAAWLAIWLLLLTQGDRRITTVRAFQEALANNQRPTLVQFYSPHCAGCMAVKPLVDQLEKEAGGRIQIIRLSIDTELGKTLVATYGVIFTPTFVYFDKAGNKLRDTVFVLDRARILQEIGQA